MTLPTSHSQEQSPRKTTAFGFICVGESSSSNTCSSYHVVFYLSRSDCLIVVWLCIFDTIPQNVIMNLLCFCFSLQWKIACCCVFKSTAKQREDFIAFFDNDIAIYSWGRKGSLYALMRTCRDALAICRPFKISWHHSVGHGEERRVEESCPVFVVPST